MVLGGGSCLSRNFNKNGVKSTCQFLSVHRWQLFIL